MVSRRQFLGRVGGGVAVGTAGCTFVRGLMGDDRNEEGIQPDEERSSDYRASYQVRLEAREWDAVSLQFGRPSRLYVDVDTLEEPLYVMVMTADEFDRYYRESNSPAPNYQVAADDDTEANDAVSRNKITITDPGEWYFVADNTDYFPEHSPNAAVNGFFEIIFVG